jgi:hypothetical protein
VHPLSTVTAATFAARTELDTAAQLHALTAFLLVVVAILILPL